jgi:hypothetical protein
MIGLALRSLQKHLTIIQIRANQGLLWLVKQRHDSKSQEISTKTLQIAISVRNKPLKPHSSQPSVPIRRQSQPTVSFLASASDFSY